MPDMERSFAAVAAGMKCGVRSERDVAPTVVGRLREQVERVTLSGVSVAPRAGDRGHGHSRNEALNSEMLDRPITDAAVAIAVAAPNRRLLHGRQSTLVST